MLEELEEIARPTITNRYGVSLFDTVEVNSGIDASEWQKRRLWNAQWASRMRAAMQQAT